MATLATSPAERSSRIPWYLWCAALAVTSVTIGAHWDVSWHRSIGRDSFWTPAHMAIYLCGVLAGIYCGYLILFTTFFRPQALIASSVRVLGFRGPLGAFIAAWGGIAMLTSAPFDNWWHNAYGLDVKIISPPHSLLNLGIWAVCIGSLLLIVTAMNRAEGAQFHRFQRLMLYISGLMLVLSTFFVMEYTWDVHLHASRAYIALAIATPLYFAAIHICSRHRWAATWMTMIYTVLTIGLILILPLFPASPKLGPVFQNVTRMVPPKFPLLLIVPAIAFDLLMSRAERWKPWLLPPVAGPLFVVTLVAVQWPFASFLMTKAAANRFFGNIYFRYSEAPWSNDVLRRFTDPEHGLVLVKGLLLATFCAVISTWLGIALGNWMRKIKR